MKKNMSSTDRIIRVLIAAIVVGSIAAVALIAFFVYYFAIRKNYAPAPDVVGDGNGGITAPFESGYFVVMKKLPMHNMIT